MSDGNRDFVFVGVLADDAIAELPPDAKKCLAGWVASAAPGDALTLRTWGLRVICTDGDGGPGDVAVATWSRLMAGADMVLDEFRERATPPGREEAADAE